MDPNVIYFFCPHCGVQVELSPIACGTGIHGSLISFEKNPPLLDMHISRSRIEELKKENKIHGGCFKRFLVVKKDNGYIVKAVDYETD
jgi:hypothetical protein